MTGHAWARAFRSRHVLPLQRSFPPVTPAPGRPHGAPTNPRPHTVEPTHAEPRASGGGLPHADFVAGGIAERGHEEFALGIRRGHDLPALLASQCERLIDAVDEDVRPHTGAPGDRKVRDEVAD